jgi:hypothetical protein
MAFAGSIFGSPFCGRPGIREKVEVRMPGKHDGSLTEHRNRAAQGAPPTSTIPALRSVEKLFQERSAKLQSLGSAPLGVCDLFIFRCGLRPESSQEHLATSIAGVLRLRAIKPSVCDRSAKRFAQDDGSVGGLKYSWSDMQKTRKDRKSHRLS